MSTDENEKIEKKLNEILKKHPKLTEKGYNLFQELSLQHKELIHSKFIRSLLDPNGSHGEGKIFLDLFFKNVLFLKEEMRNAKGIKVLCEKKFNYQKNVTRDDSEEIVNRTGSIDILIRYEVNGQKKCVIIENKIFAGDQQKQLFRYYEAATDGEIFGVDGKKVTLKYTDDNIVLLYLTPNGHNPNSQSVGEKEYPETAKKIKKVLKTISYKVDILRWIAACLESKPKDHRVVDALIQYQEMLRK